MPTPDTLVAALRDNAQAIPDALAYQFLVDGEAEGVRYTFGQLDEKVRATAEFIRSHGSDRAMLLYPDGAGPDFVVAYLACLYSGVLAVPSYTPNPARPERTLNRMRAVATDCKLRLVLTTAEVKQEASGWNALVPGMDALTYLATDAVDASLAARFAPPTIRPDALAFLQYTSGSTSSPRGVMVSHQNLLHNCRYTAAAYREGKDSINVSWCPVGHDMGLIMGLLSPLSAGVPTFHLSPTAFIRAPLRWLSAISRYRATVSGGPNFGYELCLRRADDAALATLDLSAWAWAYNGAEPVRPATLSRFAEKFARTGFRKTSLCPSYGLAEATVLVSCADEKGPVEATVDRDALEAHRFVPASSGARALTLASSGAVVPGLGTEVRCVNPDTLATCGPAEVGELWIRGPSVCQGYWEKPEASAKVFGARAADGTSGWLRSGDLCVVRDDGEIFVTGRSKDLIIISGRNSYPQDIEQVAEDSHPMLRKGCAAAFSLDTGTEEVVVLMIEVEKSSVDSAAQNLKAISTAIRRAVGESTEVVLKSVVLLAPGSVHKTSSGKIQRSACKASYLDGPPPGLIAQDTL